MAKPKILLETPDRRVMILPSADHLPEQTAGKRVVVTLNPNRERRRPENVAKRIAAAKAEIGSDLVAKALTAAGITETGKNPHGVDACLATLTWSRSPRGRVLNRHTSESAMHSTSRPPTKAATPPKPKGILEELSAITDKRQRNAFQRQNYKELIKAVLEARR